MMLTLSTPVFAANTPSIDKDAPKTGSITITKEGAGFTAYQVLKATQSGDAYDYTATDNFKDFSIIFNMETIQKIKLKI